MHPTILLQPIHTSSADILRSFVEDKYLSQEQLDFLYWNQIKLSSPDFDPVLKYYLDSIKKKHGNSKNTFLLHHEILNFDAIEALKKRLKESLKTQEDHLIIHLSHKQLLQFRELMKKDLIYYRTSQLIHSYLFYPRGVPPVLFFAWGKYFGVIKYVIPFNSGKLEINALVYFENMENRNLDKCVEDYHVRLKNNIQYQKVMLPENSLVKNEFSNTISLENNFVKPEVQNVISKNLFENDMPPNREIHTPQNHTPRLTLSDSFLIHHI